MKIKMTFTQSPEDEAFIKTWEAFIHRQPHQKIHWRDPRTTEGPCPMSEYRDGVMVLINRPTLEAWMRDHDGDTVYTPDFSQF